MRPTLTPVAVVLYISTVQLSDVVGVTEFHSQEFQPKPDPVSFADCGAQLLPFHNVSADILRCLAFVQVKIKTYCRQISVLIYKSSHVFYWMFDKPAQVAHAKEIIKDPRDSTCFELDLVQTRKEKSRDSLHTSEDLSFALKVPSLIRPKGLLSFPWLKDSFKHLLYTHIEMHG